MSAVLLSPAMAQTPSSVDGGKSSTLNLQPSDVSSTASVPPLSLESHSPIDEGQHALEFEQRFYGDRNNYVDPSFRAGDFASVTLPNLQLAATLPTVTGWTDIDVPFVERNIRTEDALVHFGPFKLDADRVTASMVFTDNVHQSEHNREAKAVSMVAVENIRATWALSDSTQLALQGDLILLPFEGSMGLNGFGMPRDTLAFALGTQSSTQPYAGFTSDMRGDLSSQFEYSGWDVVVRDSFGFRDFRLRQSFDTYLDEELTLLEADINPGLEGYRFRQLDEAGYNEIEGAHSYLLGAGKSGEFGESGASVDNETWSRTRNRTRYAGEYDDDERTNMEFSNSLSLTAIQTEGQIRPFARAYRTDSHYWYGDEADEEQTRPDWREGATIGLLTDRPSLRFPPYVTHTIARDSNDDGWRQTTRLGVAGPTRVTDYIFFTGNVGMTSTQEPNKAEERDWIYEFHLAHQPRPMTTQSIDYARFVEEPENRLRTQTTYRLRQGIGGRMAASFIATRTDVTQGSGADSSANEQWATGGSLSYTHGSIGLAWRSFYEREWDDDTGYREPDWRHEIEARLRVSSWGRAMYRYTWEDEGDKHEAYLDTDLYRHRGIFRIGYRFRLSDTTNGKTYFENLIVLTAIQSLDGWSLDQMLSGRDERVTAKPK